MAQFVLTRRIVERDSPFKSVKTLVNVAHVVSASEEKYTDRDGSQRDGTLLVLSIGKVMSIEESPDIFWERAQKRRHWWD